MLTYSIETYMTTINFKIISIYKEHSVFAYLFFLFLFSISFISVIFCPEAAPVLPLLLLYISIIYFWPLTNLYLIICFVIFRSLSLYFSTPYRSVDEVISLSIIPIFFAYIVTLFKNINNRDRKTGTGVTSLMLFILFWSMITMIWTTDPYHGIVEIIGWITMIFVVCVFNSLLTSEKALIKVLNIFPFLAIILGFFIMATHFGYSYENKFVDIYDGIRLFIPFFIKQGLRSGGLMIPTEASNILVITIFAGLALLYDANITKKIFLFLVIIFSMICMFITSSKSAVGALILGLILFVLLVPFYRKWFFSIQFVVLLLIAMIMLFTDFVLTEGAFTKRVWLVASGTQGFLKSRLIYWSIGFEHLWDTLGIGVGIGGFVKFIKPVAHAHSVHLSILFDLGVVGFIALLLIYMRIIMKLIETINMCQDENDGTAYRLYCLVAAMFSMFIYGTVGQEYTYLSFWVVLSLTMCAAKIAEDDVLKSNTFKLRTLF